MVLPASLQHWIEVPALVTSSEKIVSLSISLNQAGFTHRILVDCGNCC